MLLSSSSELLQVSGSCTHGLTANKSGIHVLANTCTYKSITQCYHHLQEYSHLVAPFNFLYFWSYCSKNWTVYINLSLRHILFMFFQNSYTNLTKCILVLQQLQRKEQINTLHIFIYKPHSTPMGGSTLPNLPGLGLYPSIRKPQRHAVVLIVPQMFKNIFTVSLNFFSH